MEIFCFKRYLWHEAATIPIYDLGALIWLSQHFLRRRPIFHFLAKWITIIIFIYRISVIVY